MAMMPQTPAKPRLQGDKETATFRWELYLTNGKIFDGYSAIRDRAEKHDKQQLLQDCIGRIVNSGYLDKCYQMLWFKRTHFDRNRDTLVLEMYTDRYVAHDYLALDLSTTQFIERIYAARQSGQFLDYKQHLPPRLNKRQQDAIDFDFSLARFPSYEQFVTHCRDYLKPRYVFSRVEAWYHHHKHSYPGQGGAPQPGAVYAGPDPANQQTVQQAQQAVQNFQNKFTTNR